MERIRKQQLLLPFLFLLLIASPLAQGVEWELTFLDLQRLLEENHPLINRAQETLAGLERDLKIAKAAYSPSLWFTTTPFHIHNKGEDYFETSLHGDLSLLYGRLRGDLFMSPQDLDYSYQLGFSYTLFQDPYLQASYLRIRDLEEAYIIAEKRYITTKGEALMDLLKLLLLKEQREIRYEFSLEDLFLAQEELKKTQERIEMGVLDEMELLLRELQLRQWELEVKKREDAFHLILEDLTEILGLEDKGVIFPLISSIPLLDPPPSKEEMIELLLMTSVHLMEARRFLEKEEQAFKRELQNNFPQTSISGEYRYDSIRGETWSFMLRMTHSLFDGGVRQITLQVKEEALEKALFAYREEEKRLMEKVEELWNTMKIKEDEYIIASLRYDLKALEVLQGEEMERKGYLDMIKLGQMYREQREVGLQLLEAKQAYLLAIMQIKIFCGIDIVDKMVLR